MIKIYNVQYDIEYHIVWIPKYRYKVLNGKKAKRARNLIRQNCNSMDKDGYYYAQLKSSGATQLGILVGCYLVNKRR